MDGQAVASQIWFVKDGVASIFKLAYIEEFGKLSVGTVLTHELMRRAIDEDKVRIIDYLSGDDAYKKDWMTRRRERRGIIAFNQRRPQGIMAAARHFGGRWVKALRSRGAPVAGPPPG
jgi:CelD/BcsL family acetyltransferase involved in cellulose biosynthesis